MTPEELAALIAVGETRTVEFKSDQGPLPDNELLETVVCLANGQGGFLLIGVEDDGVVTGLHPKHCTHPGSLAAFVANRTVPPLSVEVDFVEVPQGTVAVLSVPAVRQPVATSDGKLLIRYLDTHGQPGCRPLYPHELPGWRADRGTADVSALLVSDASWEDLDPLEFARLRRMVHEFHGDATLLELDDDQVARALGLVQSEQGQVRPTLAGLLLVGKETALREHVPAHEVAFQVLRGTDVAMNEFRRWPLLRTLEWILESFQVRNEERELNIGLFRVSVPAYDPRGFREAVNNGLIHRDYTRLGAVHVQVHDDHIRVSNPGGFVEGVRPDNLLVTEPRPRNPRLADAFKRIGLVERTGRGVAIIYNGQLRNGRLPPDYSLSTEAGVNVIVPGGPADLDFVQLVVTEENRQQRALGVGELLILAHVWRERTIDTPAAARMIQRDETQARAVLGGLVEAGLLEGRGAKKGRTFLLSAGVYRALGRPAAYVRARGFEPEQMEQMVLQYVRAHGRITRREVMELCRVNTNQAVYVLRKLVRQGKIHPVGRGRGAGYQMRKNAE
ncbi:MAG: putative DNA binding domain-containing protein [Anaerolineae bacterium]|nr:putative DNA binding domain-containing protein [Anaerolineae bacterium]